MQSTLESMKYQLFAKKSERRYEDPIGVKPLFDEAENLVNQRSKEIENDSSPHQDQEVASHKRKRLCCICGCM